MLEFKFNQPTFCVAEKEENAVVVLDKENAAGILTEMVFT